MTDLIGSLIDKVDAFEVARDQIAQILADESANQQALATAAGKDPNLWKFRVFTEHSNPWGFFQDHKYDDTSPIVNVIYDTSTFPKKNGNSVGQQKAEATYHVDIHAVGLTRLSQAGHEPGDKEAAFNAHRGLRLARNILMAAQNTYLQLRGVVWSRWVQDTTVFRPMIDQNPVPHVMGARLTLGVDIGETSPQFEEVTLEEIGVTLKRSETGEVLTQLEFRY